MTPTLLLLIGLGLMALSVLLIIIVAPAAMIGAQGLNQLDEEKTVILTNRTGGALLAGGIYAIDLVQSATESTSAELGAGNAVAVATANLNCPMVIALDTYSDDATGMFVLASPYVDALVEGTTDISIGDVLIPINGQAYLKTQSAVVLTTGCAQAHAAFTTNGTGTIKVAFDGRRRMVAKAPAS